MAQTLPVLHRKESQSLFLSCGAREKIKCYNNIIEKQRKHTDQLFRAGSFPTTGFCTFGLPATFVVTFLSPCRPDRTPDGEMQTAVLGEVQSDAGVTPAVCNRMYLYSRSALLYQIPSIRQILSCILLHHFPILTM